MEGDRGGYEREEKRESGRWKEDDAGPGLAVSGPRAVSASSDSLLLSSSVLSPNLSSSFTERGTNVYTHTIVYPSLVQSSLSLSISLPPPIRSTSG